MNWGQTQMSGKGTTYTVEPDEKSTSVALGNGFILICAKQCAAWNSAEIETPSFFVSAIIAAVSDSETFVV